MAWWSKRTRGPGGYAQRRYENGLRRWRRRVRVPLLVAFGPVAAISLLVAYADPAWKQWLAGAAFGCVCTLWLWIRSTPPHEVENWNLGAESERRTAAAIAPLLEQGWHALHDVSASRGNYDHILVGPAGVFVLETKAPRGTVEVRDGVPWVQRRHDKDGRSPLSSVRGQVLGAAARLNDELRQRTGMRLWVHAVVVFWGEFPEGIASGERCHFIAGNELASWLCTQEHRLNQHEIQVVASALGSLAAQAAQSCQVQASLVG